MKVEAYDPSPATRFQKAAAHTNAGSSALDAALGMQYGVSIKLPGGFASALASDHYRPNGG